MQQSITDIFFALLRYSLVLTSRAPTRDLPFTEPLSAEQWKQIFALSKKQALMGVIYSGVQRLPANLQPPKELMDSWSKVVLRIMAANSLMNGTAAKLTQIFAAHNRKTIILKGQANALLYPDPHVRQAGDIDILVEGGRSSVLKLLKEMGVMNGPSVGYVHHVHLKDNLFGKVSVEVHFSPTFNRSPITNRRLQSFLAQELAKTDAVKMTVEGFYAPSISYALVMQLSHIFRHFYEDGIGLRQIADYYLLLCRSSESDRTLVRSHLRQVGLFNMAGALMWIMELIFALPANMMICTPDERRGQLLFENMIEGGNFGKYASDYSRKQSHSVLRHWLDRRVAAVRRIQFDFSESIWDLFGFIFSFFKTLPFRIKARKVSLWK